MTTEPSAGQQYWDQRYSQSDRVWSGRANPRLVEVADSLAPGRALDLGCGEGADAIWLAEHGWQVLAVDVSAVALQRGAAAADQQHLLDRIDFEQHDLGESFPEGMFDLVSAHYLHTPVELEREPVLRRAADQLVPGGVLLIVDHETAPPWSPHKDRRLPSGSEVLDALQVDERRWRRLRVDTVDRSLTGPDGQVATVGDSVIVLQRVGESSR